MNGYVTREYFKTRKYCILNKLLAEYTHELEDLFLYAKPGQVTRVFWKSEGWEPLKETTITHNGIDNLDYKNYTSVDLTKTSWDIRECFRQIRLCDGDVKLSIEMQQEICNLVERFYIRKEKIDL